MSNDRDQRLKAIYDLVASVPAGQVTTYGVVAKKAGVNPRYVGYALHRNPEPARIPCHRVVNVAGQLAEHFAFDGLKGQQQRLEAEGVVVRNGRVDLARYGCLTLK